jgi:type II secretory pathway pseudopilin PulG
VLWLPLLGAAYSRARESTCDRHGLACSKSHEGAARALAALAAGSERWKKLDVVSYIKQANQSSSFWMSFHELIAGYPWVTKRAARVMDTKKAMPKRNGFAYILALFVPYAGRMGAGFGLIVMIYIIGVLAAIALPAYHDFTARAKVEAALVYSLDARETLGDYYETTQDVPESLEAVGISSELGDGSQMTLDPEYMVLTISMEQGDLIFTPRVDEQGNVIWHCSDGEGLKPSHLPASCRAPEE